MPRVFVLKGVPTPYNDALFRHVAAQPGVELLVAYCAWNEPNRSWAAEGAKGYPYTVMKGRSPGGMVHVNPGVAGVIRAFGPDVAVLSGSYTIPTMRLAAHALRAEGVPWLYWGEELSHGPRPALRRALRAVLRRVLRSAYGVLAVGSRAVASYRRAGVPERRIADFRYAADVESFRLDGEARARARAEVRASLGVSGGGGPLFLFCGQLIPRKGVDTLLSAHAALRGRGVASTLVLVGDGRHRERFERMAGELGVADSVRWAGFVQPPELPRWFAAADALVLPSRQEGWGLVVHEALAAGLPVLASDRVNAAADLVRDGETGWLFPVGDAQALAERMRALAECPDRCRLAESARAAAEGGAPARAAPRLAALLGAVLRGEDLCEA
ncbi:MAG TPA: glycosyltransferase family 4 protein [Longimicrobium sp.]|jgi:glycosyltransferase involved in cell wall biosynthesis